MQLNINLEVLTVTRLLCLWLLPLSKELPLDERAHSNKHQGLASVCLSSELNQPDPSPEMPLKSWRPLCADQSLGGKEQEKLVLSLLYYASACIQL